MASSYTDLGLEQQAAGENTNTWGAPKLNNALGRINNLIGGFYTVTLTGDYTLTTSNSSTAQADNTGRQALLKFNGTLSANATMTVPSVGMQWCVWNNTNKALTFTTGAGSTVVVDAGDKNVIWCDGSNVHQIYFGGLGLKDYIAAISASAGAVPGVTGNAGKYLYTDGTSALWRQLATSDINAFSATASVVRTGTSTAAALTPGDTYGALAEVTLTDATTIAVDMSTFVNARVTLGGNRTLGNPTNPKVGQGGLIAVVQDGTGSRTLAFGSNWKRSGGAPTLTTTPGAIDFITYQVITSTYILYDLIRSPS